eukprot:CAMPEP_0195527302 /NCGR_PEP_ID=MMETSP0794_2-20130614/28871_1 /TAXON_ID=515487 /ORGANISM="Stephanopyxis turris, Strain CCMP 815" /LENGTH=260 /DNA_ID=CAMNT_0040658183 /DNA_START=37 /DNA_END=816 /DNA_ORIENTATION=+
MSIIKTIALFGCFRISYGQDADFIERTNLRRRTDLFDVDSRIIGGQVTNTRDYAYQVALYRKGIVDDTFICGGTLIAPDMVLSAAHCLHRYHDRYVSPEIIRIIAGIHDLDNKEFGRSFDVLEIRPHPDYDSNTQDNDLVVIKLNGSSNYEPILLNESEIVPSEDQDLHVIGWGNTNEMGNPSSILQEVTVNHLTTENCRTQYETPFVQWRDYGIDLDITESMMCASDEGEDACSGDSGGPLIIKGEGESSDVQVGVVSW